MAGFFGFFDYTKPGPGVDKDALKKRSFFLFIDLFMRKFWKIIQLNMLYFICCIPIVTIGPATAGFVYVLRNFSREEHAWIASDFFEKGFKQNFKQSFLHALYTAILLLVLALSDRFYRAMWKQAALTGGNTIVYAIGSAFVLIALMILTFMQPYVYLMIVTFEMKLKDIYKNALIFAVAKLPKNILVALCCVIILLPFASYYLIGLILVPFFLLGLIGFIVVFWSYLTIEQLMIVPARVAEEIEE
ncbi:MAG: YesL family protein [Hyphomonadaceae bacterium]|nr:YesL family protein [Clostridia bacterium]